MGRGSVRFLDAMPQRSSGGVLLKVLRDGAGKEQEGRETKAKL